MFAAIGARLSLRTRLFLGMLVVTFSATIGFAIAVHEFVEVLEDELLNQALRRELDSLVIDYRSDTQIAGKRGASGQVFVIPPGGDGQTVPAALRTVGPTRHEEIHIHGREYYAARRDVDGARIYFMLDVESIEDLEDRLAAIGWTTLAGAVLLALIIAVVFSYLILRPVRALASRLASYHPGQPNEPIAHEYGDRDIRVIAESFDSLIDRFHAFIEREQTFTEDAGHELRTPLAIALSANELVLQQSDLSPQARTRIERTHAACLRMQRLVSALLFLAREGGEQNEYADAATVLDELLPFYRSEIHKKGLELEVTAEPAPVAAPVGIVDCVLHNLLENALEHTERGTVRVHLDASRLVVEDDGEGIPREALDHIFDRRYRSPESRGLGIGLYLVQRICHRLDWPISVDSLAGRGTRFEIRFS